MVQAETAFAFRRLSRLSALQGLLVIAGVWMLTGLFLDGWAHSAKKPDSFFTPWHAVLYSGFLVASAIIVADTWLRNPRTTWRERLQRGDRVSIAGLALFGLGGVTDLAWHELFGIEVNLDALLSPTHLLLLSGALLALSGPLRAALRRDDAGSWATFAPALTSLALATGVVIFFTMYASPFGQTVVPAFASVTTHTHDFSAANAPAFAELREKWALTAILFTTVIAVTPLVLMARRWRHLPRGSFVLFAAAVGVFEAAGGELEHWPLALAFPIAGAVAEHASRVLRSTAALAAVTAAALWLGYFALIAITDSVGWQPELWSGVTFLAAALAAVIAAATPSRIHSA